MKRVAVIDYELGNLPSVTKALEKVGAAPAIVASPDDLSTAFDSLVLPGVGHFGTGARNLRNAGFVGPLRDWAASGRPFLGICVGLQLLFAASEEDPGEEGLGIVDGTVKRLRSAPKIPHMGWNTISERRGIASVLDDDDMTYFVHSFYVEPAPDAVAGVTEYGDRFCSIVDAGNVVGFQFHPEKSAGVGQRLLSAFVDR